MGIIDESRAIIQSLDNKWYQDKVAAIDMLRLDLLHPVVSGNKWYKLRLNVKHAIENGFKTIVTSGGGYSNHLIATAYAAKIFGLKAIGVVRGKYDVLTPTLEACKEQGMELIFATKEDYEDRHEPEWARRFVEHFDEIMIIPEGGANEWGRAGAGLINRFIKDSYTHIAVSVGTGTTMIGIRNKTNVMQQVLGFAPMKQGGYLKESISEHLQPEQNRNWQLSDEWHFGGFAKWNAELLEFMNDFYRQNNIPLDLVYTSKMMYGIRQMVNDNFFGPDARVLCIHSGGVQGNVSVKDKLIY
jgi:1-aminocyclopropane-1-carboxylate deaminase